jgi:hypothetical protein
MKLKAPEGVGDPCIAGVVVTSRNGFYEVEPKVGALLIECFGFVEADGGAAVERPPEPVPRPSPISRRGRPDTKKA